MNDTTYLNALNRKATLEAELREVDQFLQLYQKFSDVSGTQKTLPLVGGEKRTGTSDAVNNLNGENKSKLGPIEFASLAEGYVRKAGHPLTRTELVEAFDNDGVELPSDDKARYLGTILWRNREKFKNVPGRGYSLDDILTDDDRNRIRQASRPSDDEANVLRKIAEMQALAPNLPRQEVISSWNLRQQIPPEVDRKLVGAARHQLQNDDLSTAHLRLLRETFIDEVKKRR